MFNFIENCKNLLKISMGVFYFQESEVLREAHAEKPKSSRELLDAVISNHKIDRDDLKEFESLQNLLSSETEQVNNETKHDIKNNISEMLSEWLYVSDKQWYNSLRSLLESTGFNIPILWEYKSWNVYTWLEYSLNTALWFIEWNMYRYWSRFSEDNEDFKWIRINSDKIEIEYDRYFYWSDTLVLNYDSNGNIDNSSAKWISGNEILINSSKEQAKETEVQEAEQAKETEVQEAEQAKETEVQEAEQAKETEAQEAEQAKETEAQETEQPQEAEVQETEAQETEAQEAEAEAQETEVQETEVQETEVQETEVQETETQELEVQESEQPQETEQQKYNSSLSFYKSMKADSGDFTVIKTKLVDNWIKLPNFWADGKFWKETYNAIVEFQKNNNLLPDGKAGTKTLIALGLLSEGENAVDFYNKNEVKSDSINHNESNLSEHDKIWVYVKELVSSDFKVWELQIIEIWGETYTYKIEEINDFSASNINALSQRNVLEHNSEITYRNVININEKNYYISISKGEVKTTSKGESNTTEVPVLDNKWELELDIDNLEKWNLTTLASWENLLVEPFVSNSNKKIIILEKDWIVIKKIINKSLLNRPDDFNSLLDKLKNDLSEKSEKEKTKSEKEKVKDTLKDLTLNLWDLSISDKEIKKSDWISLFKNNRVGFSFNSYENWTLNFDFNDRWLNDSYNKWYEVDVTFNEDGSVNIDSLRKSLVEKAKEASKKMEQQQAEKDYIKSFDISQMQDKPISTIEIKGEKYYAVLIEDWNIDRKNKGDSDELLSKNLLSWEYFRSANRWRDKVFFYRATNDTTKENVDNSSKDEGEEKIEPKKVFTRF